MTIKNTQKNISAEPEMLVVDTEGQDYPKTTPNGVGNFTKNLGIVITRECFFDENNPYTETKEIIIPLSELVRISHLENSYYNKEYINDLISHYYTKEYCDENYFTQAYIRTNYYTKTDTDDRIEDKVDEELEEYDTEIQTRYYTIEQITQLLASLQVGRGKLVTFYIDEANGDIVVQDDGFTYYTTEEADELFTIDLEEVNPSSNGILKSFQIVQGTGNSRRVLETKIDIPKDFLLKNVELKTATSNPPAGVGAGHKYFDFTFNTKDSDDNTNLTHLNLDVNALVDVYNADNVTIEKDSNNVFSVKKITKNHLDGVLDLNQVTHQDISGKVDKVQGKQLSTEDYTTQEKTKLAGIEAEANKITVDENFSIGSNNPIRNSTIYQTLLNMNEKYEYIYIDMLGNIHSLQYKPTEINLDINDAGKLMVEVTGESFLGEEYVIQDAYVDIYDGMTNEYILTVTTLGNYSFYEDLIGHSSIYGKIRNITSEEIEIDIGEPALDIIRRLPEDNRRFICRLLNATSESTVTLKVGETVLTDSLELGEVYTFDDEVIRHLASGNQLILTAILNDDEELGELRVTKTFEV